jgi:eukaryotic-like serine/threonine-protein kinase
MRRLSFGRGMIRSARFAHGGTDVIYGATWDGKPFQMFSVRSEGTESHSLSQKSLDILAVSPKGQLAVSLDRHFSFGLSSVGTLALMRSLDEEPQPLLTNVQDADWSPSGDELAITHYVDDRSQLEFPVGTVVYQAVGGSWISHSRISPDGKGIAFLEHPLPGDSAGYLAVVDLAGNKRRLSGDFADVQGLAWDPSGQAVLFSGAGAGPGTGRSIYKTTLDGKQTLLRHDSTQLMLQDVSRGGQILISRDLYRQEVFGRIYPDKQERNLGWQDNSYASYLSDDARTIVLSLQGEAAGSGYEVYIRGTEANATAIRLGEGLPVSLSPDGKWMLAVHPWGLKPSSPPQLTLLPVGLGKPKTLTDDARSHDWGTWLPDGRILFVGSECGHGIRNWIMNFDGTQAHPITPEGTIGTCVSARGELLAADPDGRFWLYPVNGDDRRPVRGMSGGDSPSRWSKDEKTVYVAHPGEGTTDVYGVNLITGGRTLLYRLAPPDRAGVTYAPSVQLTSDGRSYAYSYFRILSDLYSISSLN